MSKLSNTLTMLQLLSTGRKYSIKELSTILEVTPRMIRVYKEDLEKAGIYIDTIMGPYGGYVLKQEIKIDTNKFKINLSLEDQNKYNILTRAIKEKRPAANIYGHASHESTIAEAYNAGIIENMNIPIITSTIGMHFNNCLLFPFQKSLRKEDEVGPHP